MWLFFDLIHKDTFWQFNTLKYSQVYIYISVYVLFVEHYSLIDFARKLAKLENSADYVVITVDENEANRNRKAFYLKCT